MKRISKYFFLFVVMFLACSALPIGKASAQEVSYQVFYDQLSPYGHWVNFPEEGNVWVPNAEPGFSPYQSNGYWAYTDYGWTWVSDYQWGWAPFHYGRWDFDNDYGWYWVPQYEWAPAWVAWSRAPGYYGWAPLRPGVEVDYAITNGYYVPHEHWCYVHEEYLGRRDMGRHYAPRSENRDHIRNSTMINRTNIDSRRTVYMGGPSPQEVEKSTGTPLKQLTLAPRSTPGQAITGNQVSIYKPIVAQTTAANPAPAPQKVASIRDLKPLPGRRPNAERLNASAPTSAPAMQTQPRTNPATIPPPIRSNDNTQSAPPEMRQQPVQQQTAPRTNPAVQPAPKVNAAPQQSAPKETAPPQSAPPPTRRTERYSPPNYNSPKPYVPRPVPPLAVQPPPRNEPPRNAAPPSAPPQRTEPPHAPPPSPPPTHAAPPQQDGKPHR